MFEYVPKHRYFKQKLGDYISHNIVDKYVRRGGTLTEDAANELNNLDRYELARGFYVKYIDYIGMKDSPIPKETFINDMAIYIDNLIPKFCYKKIEDKESSATTYKVLDGAYGLHYYFDINKEGSTVKSKCFINETYIDEMRNSNATDKQIQYIKYLAKNSGYILIAEDISKSIASYLISFLRGDIDKEPLNLFSYLSYE